jgi:hypothetical protein
VHDTLKGGLEGVIVGASVGGLVGLYAGWKSADCVSAASTGGCGARNVVSRGIAIGAGIGGVIGLLSGVTSTR